ncbi:peptide ABC transporter substrate-binding protein [Clostridium sp. KNHs214]|uniref:peptide ABC transporter substrate-binding protein n=1 Tax=Clostridium sp. KNHs214 TaxID=1540257 RepID=UPI000550975B|nr:peptide ABC transporter substrate-binding protein [Clostridium sp. KNHs214]
MKGKKLLAVVLGATLLATTALVGCGEKKPAEGDKDKGKAVKMDKDQYLNLNLQYEPKSLDLSRSNDIYGAQVFTEVYEGLTRVEQDKDGKDVIKAAGAEKWEHNEEGTVWTFHLRDYNWTDGKKVTAKDFEFSILRTLDPKTASGYAFLLSPIKGADEYNAGKGSKDAVGVKAVDDKTLEFTLKQPCPYFLDLTYFKLFLPQREDIVKKHGEKYGTEANTLEVYCGPFVVKEWSHQQQIVLEKNDKYWDKDSVKLQKVNLKMIKEANAAYGSLLNGTLDTGGVRKPEWIKKFDQKKDEMENIKGFRPSTGYMFFNQKDKLLSNANVRKAFSAAYTRDDYANVITYGINAPAYGWCPPTVQLGGKDYRELVNEEPIKKMVEENKDPKELLIKGLKELGMDPDPSKVTVTILHGSTSADTRKAAEYEQEMYKKALGINVKAEYMTFDILQKRTDEMDYQIAGMGWTGDYNDPNTFFDMWMSGAGIVPTGWSNKKYDEILKKAMSTIDQKERLKLYKEAEKILLVEDVVIAPTTYDRKNTFRYKYVKNLMTPLFGCDFEFKYAYTDGRGK